MANPTITINGKDIEMQSKARLWRIVAEFQEKRKGAIPTEDFIEEHCKVIAAAYGLTTDEVLDNIDIADVLPICLQAVKTVGDKLTEKVKKNPEEKAI
jgi:hypothetical protein